MSKEIIVPELFPLTIDGNIQWVKRGVFAKQIAETQAIKLKAEIKKSHVEEMLDQCEKGTTEMSPEAPDEMKKTFDKVRSDWDDAVQHVSDLAAEEQEKADAVEKEKKEKEDAEIELFESVKDETASLADLSKLFNTGDGMNQFTPKGKVTDQQLLGAFNTSLKLGEFNNWMKGDLVVELENRGQLGVVMKICEATGQPYANVYNAAKTARNVPPEKRTKGVSYTIFAEIANAKYSDKPEEHSAKMEALVDKAAAGEIKSSQEARELKNKAAGKKAPETKLPEEDEKHEFIVVDIAQGLIQACVGFPKELFTEGATIIDKKTGKMFQSFKAKPENRWAELPIYTAPKPPEAAPAKAATGAAKPGVGNQLKPAKGKK